MIEKISSILNTGLPCYLDKSGILIFDYKKHKKKVSKFEKILELEAVFMLTLKLILRSQGKVE